MKKSRIIALSGMLLVGLMVSAGQWRTHFAYNNVTQIAMMPDRVFAISDGSLFSVDKQTEQIRVYNSQSGLHSTGITCIHYDEAGSQLIIAYGTGKIDILSSRGVRYVGDLYDKDMTQRKTIYNVTIHGRTAYLATHYGVQTMDLRETRLVDSYWLRPNGEETPIQDVLLRNDSIYAFAEDSLYCASMAENLSDYAVWKREVRGRVEPDTEKGQHYKDATDHWFAGYGEGIIRFTPTSRLTYKPLGPIHNTPYYVSSVGDELFMLAGGRWTAQYYRPGDIMRCINGKWHTITSDYIKRVTNSPVRDFMNVAVDPSDTSHYFITSYGTGLYEMRGDSLVSHTIANGVIGSAVASNPREYTRLTGAHFDSGQRLWFLDAGDVEFPIIILEGGQFYGLPIVVNGTHSIVHIPSDLIIDQRNENRKWIGSAYKTSGLYLLDDHGTPTDPSDDRAMYRDSWINQHGQEFKPTNLHALVQDRQGRIWLATELGVAYIDHTTDFFTSDAIMQPDVMDQNGENPVISQVIKAICQTPDGCIWIGTQSLGVYVLNSEATEIVAHYTTDNSAMPANGIISLASDETGRVFVGTAEGLVEYDPNGPGEGLNGVDVEGQKGTIDEGVMQRWRLHLSYVEPSEVEASAKHIYAAANGSLFSVNRDDESLEYWSKANGLNGNSVAHIAFDALTEQLVVAYEDGRIDLLSEDGTVTQMPDLYMKAGSVAVTIHCLATGSRYTYAGTSFGIIALNTRKAETADTYYIGSEAAAVEVQQIAEWNDSLYAFSYDRMYKASLRDNLVDYTFWRSEALPCERVSQAQVWKDALYTIQHDSLYRRSGATWQLVRPEPVQWMHAHDGQMLVYLPNRGLYRLTEEEQLVGLTNVYLPQNAVYSKGEYWLATKKGLVRLGSGGDDYFHTEGPNSNFGYCMYAVNDRLYSAIGGKWATQFLRYGRINIYDGSGWRGIEAGDIGSAVGTPAIDIVSLAVDPNDAGHFFAATYGTGVFEFRDYRAVKHYTTTNSTLREAKQGHNPDYYTRTDGAMMDDKGNLWVLNATEVGKPLHILSPNGIWRALSLYSGGVSLSFTTPGAIWTDRRNAARKWMIDQRETTGVILFDDGGTPAQSGDDRCLKRSSFVDQNGNTLTPATIYCLTQDQTNRIWIGTPNGIITIPANVDFFSSNACRRIIIPRNDGTGLGDYLLGDEQINCMAVDGGNRMWIGTANSGLYLIEDDTITVAHFTETNSLLPSNSIQSIAIMSATGEVFVGTDRGIASYRSDASEAREDMSGAYAFPNPVRPDYRGMISIAGLMENTVVNIVDAGGNLVCKTKSHGGLAVWDGKLQDGRFATPGVYTALCNEPGGKHTVVKILVIR